MKSNKTANDNPTEIQRALIDGKVIRMEQVDYGSVPCYIVLRQNGTGFCTHFYNSDNDAFEFGTYHEALQPANIAYHARIKEYGVLNFPQIKTPAPAAEPAPAPTQHGPRHKSAEPAKELPADFFESCTKSQRELYQNSFVGREKAFKEFLVIKRELAVIGIKVGKMTASQSTIKSWNINGAEAGNGKAAIFWDTNGWTIGPRTVDGELPEGLQDWEIMEHLADNNVYANGLHASHWYDAIDEDAQAEALAAQKKQSSPVASKHG